MTALRRIGIVAPEFPPGYGGMSEVAGCLSEALGSTCDVVVLTTARPPLPSFPVEVRTALTLDPRHDTRILSDIDVDVWLALNAGLAPLAPRLRAPLFLYCHGNDFLNPWIPYGPRWIEAFQRPYLANLRHRLRRRRVSVALPYVRHLFANSTFTQTLFSKRYGYPTDSITVCSPGVRDIFFQTQSQRSSTGSLRLLTVAHLSQYARRKNVDGVLRAVSLLENDTVLRYDIVGDGNDAPRLRELARELGIADRVRFLGSVDRERLCAAYREADLFVLTPFASDDDIEGFGIVYLEANAAGVPVLGSRAGGATDAIEDGVTGFILEDSSPEAIAAGIQHAAAERNRFNKASLIAHAERSRWRTVADKLIEEIEAHLA